MARQGRLGWIDSLKGIGILAVVLGHVLQLDHSVGQVIFMFHMPLFFLIGGYLLRVRDDGRGFLMSKARHLLVPYAAFMLLVYTPQAIQGLLAEPVSAASVAKAIARPSFGGRALSGTVAAFWFVTCFFLAQQLTHWLLSRFSQIVVAAIMAIMLALGYANAAFLPDLKFPWSANAVLVAAPLMFLGYLARQKATSLNAPLAAMMILVGIYLLTKRLPNTLDIKATNYGIPIVTLFCSIACASLLASMSRVLEGVPILRKPLAALGNGSMVIMYLHQVVQLTAAQFDLTNSHITRIVLAIVIPYSFYCGAQRSAFTRRFFLGEGCALKPFAQNTRPSEPEVSDLFDQISNT